MKYDFPLNALLRSEGSPGHLFTQETWITRTLAGRSVQVRLLQDLFFSPSSKNGFPKRLFDGLEVKTVDGFQGREKEVGRRMLSVVPSSRDGLWKVSLSH
jgi:hypothetical protein